MSQPPIVSTSVPDLISKARSKNEVYRILATEGNIYLPRKKSCDLFFLKQLCLGEKNVRIPAVTAYSSSKGTRCISSRWRTSRTLP